MKLRINGEIRKFDYSIETVAMLLKTLKINPKFVAVELNGEVVYKEDFETKKLNDGDKLEIVSFVGGG